MLSLVAFMLIGCEPPPPPVPGAVERTGAVLQVVNGQNVTQGMVDSQLEQLPDETRDQIKARGQEARVTEQVVIGELLYQEALKQKLQDDPKAKEAVALAERGALATVLIERTVDARMTDDAVKKWYDDHAVQFAKKQTKARHILFDKKDKAEAEKTFEALKADRSKFGEIAMAKSIDKRSAKEGGDLGWFEEKQMVPEFAAALATGTKGQLIGPVETKFGFHIIELEDSRDAIPVDEVKDKIKGQLKNDLVSAYIEELKKGATITDATAAAPAGGATVTPAPATDTPAPGAPPAAGK